MMNELLQLKKIERAVDMWWEDQLLIDFFSKDTEAEFGKAAQAAKKAKQEEIRAIEAAKEADENPLRRAIKKPTGQKGVKGQGVFGGKRRAAAFQ